MQIILQTDLWGFITVPTSNINYPTAHTHGIPEDEALLSHLAETNDFASARTKQCRHYK